MVLASLGDFLWSLLVIFFMVVYFMMLFSIIIDIFRRHDASGWKKAAWLLCILFLPLLGMLAYLITNSSAMAQRSVAEAAQSKQDFDQYVQSVAAQGGSAAEIERAKALLDSGAISQAEYEQLKAKALAT